MNINLKEIEAKILQGKDIEKEKLIYFLENQNLSCLIKLAKKIKSIYKKDYIHLCCAISIKTNGCFQNCRYCAQSGFWNEENSNYKDLKEILEFSKLNDRYNIKFIGVNSSTGYFNELNKERLKEIYNTILTNTKLKICAAHGILRSFEEVEFLKKSGVYKYEHNIQTSRKFFNNICTTHSYDEKINTIKYAKKGGLEICSGVIIGMNENLRDRIEMALTLKELEVKSVPINILNPAPRTPFYNRKIYITIKEVLRTFAIFRIILKDADIIFGAGRKFMGKYINMAFSSLNGIVVGNMLTHKGETIEKDINIITNSTTNI